MDWGIDIFDFEKSPQNRSAGLTTTLLKFVRQQHLNQRTITAKAHFGIPFELRIHYDLKKLNRKFGDHPTLTAWYPCTFVIFSTLFSIGQRPASGRPHNELAGMWPASGRKCISALFAFREEEWCRNHENVFLKR